MKKRLALFLCSFAALYAVNFFLPRLMPGDPFLYTSSVSGEDLGTAYSPAQLAQLRAYYGLDDPLPRQFTRTLAANLRGEFGDSIFYRKPVSTVLWERLPWSLGLLLPALLLGLLLGTSAALHAVRAPRTDAPLCGLFSLLAELPAFLVGALLLFLVAARVGWLPLSGGATAFAEYPNTWARWRDLLTHALLPCLTLTLAALPPFFFTARGAFLTVAQKPYLFSARAKGLGEGRIRMHYLLRNSLSPIAARFFISLGAGVGGTVLVENVFAYPGLGRALRDAVLYRDYPMMQGIFLLSSTLALACLLVGECIGRTSEGSLP